VQQRHHRIVTDEALTWVDATVSGGSETLVSDASHGGASGASGVSGAATPRKSGRAAAEARYLQLVRDDLPTLARAGRWVVRDDHCFGRILLDHAVGGCWYDALDRRKVGFRQLDDQQLASAITLAERISAEGDPLLRRLNEQSLGWRGKGRADRAVGCGPAQAPARPRQPVRQAR
jgi:hypothetical protein